MKLLIFGSANIDHVYQLPHLVRGGETLASTGYARHQGGKGFNQAVALAKAGQPVCFAGAIGQDGLFLREDLCALGVDTRHLALLDEPTGHAIIQVDAAGQNCILLFGGANQCITPALMDQVLADFAPGDYLLMQNEISGGETLLQKAADRGLRIVLNPSPLSPELLRWPLHLVDWLILNEIEGGDLTGCAQPDAIADGLLRRYPHAHIVLTLGPEGSLYADATRRIRQAAVPTEAVDTTAAGDTFTGYFLQALLSGQPIQSALRRASVAASITVSRAGAGQSVPFAGEVQQRLATLLPE